MKKKNFNLFILFSIILGCIPFIIYISLFKGSFSITNADWGNFGSFIGGTTSALLSTFSLLILLYTLNNSLNQLRLQKIHHRQAMLLQKKNHAAELKLTNYALNSKLLESHIDSLNYHLDSKKYFYEKNGTANIANSESNYLDIVFSELEHLLKNDLSADAQSCGKVIKNIKISYRDEMFPLVAIFGIIKNEQDERFRTSFIATFMSKTHRERTYWLLRYAKNNLSQEIFNTFDHRIVNSLPLRIKNLLEANGRKI